jgi:hypothetical protein
MQPYQMAQIRSANDHWSYERSLSVSTGYVNTVYDGHKTVVKHSDNPLSINSCASLTNIRLMNESFHSAKELVMLQSTRDHLLCAERNFAHVLHCNDVVALNCSVWTGLRTVVHSGVSKKSLDSQTESSALLSSVAIDPRCVMSKFNDDSIRFDTTSGGSNSIGSHHSASFDKAYT